MKKSLSLIIATLIAFAFISCSTPTTPAAATNDGSGTGTGTGTSTGTDTNTTGTGTTGGTTNPTGGGTDTPKSSFTALSLADVKYDAAGAGGLDKVSSTPGTVGLWYDGNWCGSTVTPSNVVAAAGSLSFDYAVSGKCDYGVQLFDTIAADGTYLISATVTTGKSQNIVFNGHTYALTANTPTTVSAVVSVSGATSKAGGSLINLQIPVDSTGIAASSSFKLADAKYLAVKTSDLTISALSLSPSTAAISAGDSTSLTASGTYTYTDTDSQKYTVYLPLSAADVTWSSSSDSIATVSAGTVKGVAGGTATITATAGGKSATCDVTVNATKEYGKYFTGKTQYGETDTSNKYPGYMCLWYDNSVSLSNVSASATTYAFTRSTSGTVWYGTQLFYSAVAGTYDVSFTVKSTVAGDITINSTKYTLVADTAQTITITKTLASTGTLISIQLGTSSPTQLGDGTFTLDALSITAK